MTYYVKRRNVRTGRLGYVGPLRSRARADRERDAWRDARDSFGAGFEAETLESTRELRAEVRTWEKARPTFSVETIATGA